jgi:hypothetical protein
MLIKIKKNKSWVKCVQGTNFPQLSILENTQMKNLYRATPGLVISVMKHNTNLYEKT